MSDLITRTISLLFLTLLAGLLTGCGGGSKVLKEPVAVELKQPIGAASDDRVAATLDWVVVKDGPGTWAKNAWWDEYRLRVANRTSQTVTLSSLQVIDSLDTPLAAGLDRKQLVRASKDTQKRYQDYDLKVEPGAGTGTLIAVGTGTLVVAGVAAAATIGPAIASVVSFGATTASTPAIVGAVGTAAMVATPVFIVGGFIKGANNAEVNEQILERQVMLPLELPPSEDVSINAFFPVAPSPQSLQLVYESEDGTNILEIDTREVLQGLHLANPIDGFAGTPSAESADGSGSVNE